MRSQLTHPGTLCLILTSLIFSFQASGLTAIEADASQLLLQEKLVQQCAYCALKKNGFGRSRLAPKKEQAFWVRDTPRGLQCDFWDDSFATATSSFSIGVPADAVALFHTHPADQARFSEQDRSEALRLELQYRQDIDFFALAGRKFGLFDPRLQQTNEPLEFWYSNSLWLEALNNLDKGAACDEVELPS